MVIPPFLVVKGSFQGMAGLINFALIQKPGLAQQNKKRKNTTITSTFWDVLLPYFGLARRFSFTLAYNRINQEYSSLFIIVNNLIFMFSL